MYGWEAPPSVFWWSQALAPMPLALDPEPLGLFFEEKGSSALLGVVPDLEGFLSPPPRFLSKVELALLSSRLLVSQTLLNHILTDVLY